MGKDEEMLREIAGRAAHKTGSGYPVPDVAKNAAQWALKRIRELEGANQQLQNTNLDVGPAYHEWRSYADRLLLVIRTAKIEFDKGNPPGADYLLRTLLEAHDQELERREQADLCNGCGRSEDEIIQKGHHERCPENEAT